MKTLKLALLGATFLIGAAGAASAADIYNKGSYKDTPEPYIPAIGWTGFYFGINGGGAFFNDNSFSDNGETIVDFSRDDTWVAGVHAGYNWERPGGLVFGIEGDVDFGDNIDYLASARGRLGYAMGPTLWYATGGAAFIKADDAFGDSRSDTGWVAGGGVEYKLRPNVSVGLEGLYYDFGNGSDSDIGRVHFHEDDNNFWTARARLTYHFGERFDEPLK